METIDEKIDKYALHKWLILLFIVLATLGYCLTIVGYPLVDYDEATYAKVIMQTMHSGDVTNFTKEGANWFEKPPAYLWLAMLFVKLLGPVEYAFRLPSVILSVLCLWLVFLITRTLSKSTTIGLVASSILLVTPPFFSFAREARLDSGVILAILIGLYCIIRGWNDERYLWGVFPAFAVGFMFKSVIVFLLLPIAFFYCLAYRERRWVSAASLWWGGVVALLIFLPWHIAESIRFGNVFWNEYLLHQVFQRGLSTVTGTNNYYDYIRILWLYYTPWLWLLGASAVGLLVSSFFKLEKPVPWRVLIAPLVSAVFVFILFTAARTHLSTYIMPMFPFLAMFLALTCAYFARFIRNGEYLMLALLVPLLIFGGVKSNGSVRELITPFAYEERDVGLALATNGYAQFKNTVPLYALDWQQHETINYYGDAKVQYLDVRTAGGQTIAGPFCMVTHTMAEGYFFANIGVPRAGYENLKVLYQGKYLVLFCSDQPMKVPAFM